ncbi:MAG: peptidylprolyl isomerase [Gammaproteobacteria bacterium]|nr:MAG: peptidylprolyl isomerase [Gammaproteobacteria bacterium]
MTRISRGKHVSITYQILDEEGNLLEHNDFPVSYVHGLPNDLFEQIEAALEGRQAGDTVEVVLSPEEAFGYPDPNLRFTDVLENVPPEVRYVGAEVQMQNERGEVRVFRVAEIRDGKLTIDGNHPFAGKTLVYRVRVEQVRDATEAELKDGAGRPLH